MTRIAVLQMTSGIDPEANANCLTDACERAAGEGAEVLFTPEMSGLLDRDRKRAAANIAKEAEDIVLSQVREAAAKHSLWVALGSLAIGHGQGGWANRSFVIDDMGEVAARYDKMHMFDVDLESGESWRESNSYRAGDRIVTAQTPAGRLGLTVCYDLRFPALFEALGREACDVIAIPAAFTVPTGEAHWHVLQRARAIEASAYVVAAAQVGEHADGRCTYGHSLVVDPWGEVLLDMSGDEPGLGFAEIDAARIAEVRRQVPSLANRRPIST
ncbi:carbon-nitrogen hydrolase family protein [Qipengyuania marisflavi]|uniref:Carbon-nitrogen hydrolase family protein n=1 Tax=Qipengyuania marisflavi TaxID=2486356 RepID=A0A5S3Q0T8_9SPHN|nr:carbon-nitrogen hydrolase family protein [Qipengyuania marisflavi]TMM49957.1 carbon-nitrogen hydrolase family protein [Qipengyuania marisflavi]